MKRSIDAEEVSVAVLNPSPSESHPQGSSSASAEFIEGAVSAVNGTDDSSAHHHDNTHSALTDMSHGDDEDAHVTKRVKLDGEEDEDLPSIPTHPTSSLSEHPLPSTEALHEPSMEISMDVELKAESESVTDSAVASVMAVSSSAPPSILPPDLTTTTEESTSAVVETMAEQSAHSGEVDDFKTDPFSHLHENESHTHQEKHETTPSDESNVSIHQSESPQHVAGEFQSDNKVELHLDPAEQTDASQVPSESQQATMQHHAHPTEASVPATANATTHSTPTPQKTQLDLIQLKFCAQTLARARRLKDAPPFLQPVDPVRLGIPTYFSVVKHPMDFSTIQKRLDSGAYANADGFMADVKLMFDNCWLFNGRESVVGKMAERLDLYIKQQMEKMPTSLDAKKPKPSPSTHALPVTDRPKREVQPPTRLDSTQSLTGTHVSPLHNPAAASARKPYNRQIASDLKYAATVTRELCKPRYHAFNYPFLQPVDPVKLNIPTYPLIVTHPMDLSTITKKLDARLYANGAEYEADVRLMFRNCYAFNPVGSEVHECGRRLEGVFEMKWRERPVVPLGSVGGGAAVVGKKGGFAFQGESDDSSSSEDEGQDLNKMQENLLKLMQEVTKLAANKSSKEKKKHKKSSSSGSKVQAAYLLQQQVLAAAAAAGGAAGGVGRNFAGLAGLNASALLGGLPQGLPVVGAPSAPKKKKKSGSSSRKSAGGVAPVVVKEITYQQKKELSEKIEDLPPEKLEKVYQIIRSGVPGLDTQAAGQDEIELDIDALDKATLSKLYHFVVSNVKPRHGGSASKPKSMTQVAAAAATANGASSESEGSSSGSDSDSGSESDSDGFESGGEEVIEAGVAAVIEEDINGATVEATSTVASTETILPPTDPQTGSKAQTASSESTKSAKTDPTSVGVPTASQKSSGVLPSSLKFKKAPARESSVSSVAAVDVFGYMEQLEEKSKRESEAAAAKREKELEEQRKSAADLAKWSFDRRSSDGRNGAVSGRSPVVNEPLQIVPELERAAMYERSIQKYAGKWLDLHRQGSLMREFEESVKMESTPKYEAMLAKDRAELAADFVL